MRNVQKFLFTSVGIAVAFAVLGGPAYAVTATGQSLATIIVGLTVTPNEPLDFGVIAVEGCAVAGCTSDSSVVLTPNGTASGSIAVVGGGGAVLLGSHQSGQFAVGGAKGRSVSIQLGDGTPGYTRQVTSVSVPNPTMDITSFTSFPSGTGTLNASGALTIFTGGTLTVAAEQIGGLYQGSYDITVTY